MHWPAPTNEDLYVRVRRWSQPTAPAAAAAAPPPSAAVMGQGVGAGEGEGEGAGEGAGVDDGAGGRNREEVGGEDTGGGLGPEHLVCVPGGLRPSASLALLREAVEAARPPPSP